MAVDRKESNAVVNALASYSVPIALPTFVQTKVKMDIGTGYMAMDAVST